MLVQKVEAESCDEQDRSRSVAVTQSGSPVHISDLEVQRCKIIWNRSLTSYFGCCSLWPVSLPRRTQIEIQEKENADGKTHPSLELLAGNGEFGYRGRVESTECVRAGVTNAVNTGSTRLFHDLLQSEPLTVLSRHGLGGLRLV